MIKKLLIDKTLNLIQEIRLIHALTESSFEISLPNLEAAKFDNLKDKFGVNLLDHDSDSFDISEYIEISHSEPLTSIGEISKPLIFPHSITSYCRSLWRETRDFRYSFQGVITHQRKSLIENWIEENITYKRIHLPSKDNFFIKLRSKLLSKIGLNDTIKQQVGNLLLYSSDRGRKFPEKAWDEEYFKMLANSQFVLCPSGNYVWSYRFFESILCGAIPIVEKRCKAYDGFQFASFKDQASNLRWSEEIAVSNYNLCIQKLTVPKLTLDSELNKILKSIY